MKQRAYIMEFLKKGKRRLALAVFTDILSKALVIGFGVGAAVNAAALLVPIYGAFRISWIALVLVLLIGIITAIVHFPNDKKTALELDKRGLKERLITFVEMEQNGSSSAWKELLTEDTYRAVTKYDLKRNTPIRVEKRVLSALAGMIVLFSVVALLPSPNKELALGNHKRAEQIKAEMEKIEKAEEQLEELKELEKLSEAELAEAECVQDILEKAKEELLEAKTQEEMEKALERMQTKALQTLSQSKPISGEKKALELKNKLEEFLKKTENQSEEAFASEELKDIVNVDDLKALQEALESLTGQMSDEELAELLEQLKELEASLSNETLTREQLEQLLENLENIAKASLSDDSSQLAQLMAGTLGISYPSNQSASNQNGQSGSGSGNGNGSGSSGSGIGNGNGVGHGGSGIGGGQNQGSSYGIEKENNRIDSEEQITIPGREIGEDENLTGQTIEGDSYQITGGEGLTWSGEKVNYDTVVGQYTEEAYARIENNEVPKGMEDIVKSYFEGLNQ